MSIILVRIRGRDLVRYAEERGWRTAAVARVTGFFLGNIFEWNLSEMEAEARRAVPKGRRSFTRIS